MFMVGGSNSVGEFLARCVVSNPLSFTVGDDSLVAAQNYPMVPIRATLDLGMKTVAWGIPPPMSSCEIRKSTCPGRAEDSNEPRASGRVQRPGHGVRGAWPTTFTVNLEARSEMGVSARGPRAPHGLRARGFREPRPGGADAVR